MTNRVQASSMQVAQNIGTILCPTTFKSLLKPSSTKGKVFQSTAPNQSLNFFGRNTSDVKDHNNEKLDVKDNNKENLMSNTTTMKTLCRRSRQRDFMYKKILCLRRSGQRFNAKCFRGWQSQAMVGREQVQGQQVS